MSAPTILEIMDEMADTIRSAVTGLGVEVQVEGRLNPEPSHTPSIDIYPGLDPLYDSSTAGFVDIGDEGALRFTVRCRVQPTDHAENQDILLELMDDQTDASIANALLDDMTINGTVSDVHLESVSGYVLIPSASGEAYIGCLWRFMVVRGHS